MVEDRLKKKKCFRNKYHLFQNLRGKVMYPTITVILDYLEESSKIGFKKDDQLRGFSEFPTNQKEHTKIESPLSRNVRNFDFCT